MIYLFTGINGASKTLNAIKFVCESPEFKDRPVFYFNIDSCQMPWTEITLEQAMTWWDLPKGSVIFVDECYKLFPTRNAGAVVPEHIKRLAEHRKDGYDFIFICQKVMGQVDAFARGLVGRHIHLERIFNTNFVTWYQWQKCQDDVNNYHVRKEAIKKKVKIDKSYFKAYKSAEVHTMKANLPWLRLIGVAALICFVVGLGAKFMFGLKERVEEKPAESSAPESSFGLPFQSTSKSSAPMTVQQYLAAHTPRVEGFPHTAPVYDELTAPKTYPRLNCALWLSGPKNGECVCYTQQATKANVPANICADIVKNGYFDHALDDRAVGQKSEAGAAPAFGQRSAY